MLHKLRNAMGKRDAEYKVFGMVELDEGFFSTEIPDSEKNKPLKRGHGSQKKTKVLVLAETAEGTPTKKSDKPTKVKHIKMIVIDNLKSETIDGKVKMYVNPDSTIASDDSKIIYKLQVTCERAHPSGHRTGPGREDPSLGPHRHQQRQAASAGCLP